MNLIKLTRFLRKQKGIKFFQYFFFSIFLILTSYKKNKSKYSPTSKEDVYPLF